MRNAKLTAFIAANMRPDLAGRSLGEWESEYIETAIMRLERLGQYNDGNPAAMTLWQRLEQLATGDVAVAA